MIGAFAVVFVIGTLYLGAGIGTGLQASVVVQHQHHADDDGTTPYIGKRPARQSPDDVRGESSSASSEDGAAADSVDQHQKRGGRRAGIEVASAPREGDDSDTAGTLSNKAVRSALTGGSSSSSSTGGGGGGEGDRGVIVAPDGSKRIEPEGRLPNGGPARAFVETSWAAVSAIASKPFKSKVPLPTIWDFAVLGPCADVQRGDDTLGSASADIDQATTMEAMARMLGRVRLSAVACFTGDSVDEDTVAKALWRGAPAWRIVSVTSSDGGAGSSTEYFLERRQRLFAFAITGGSDGRAAYVERTWGRRTPLQWYGDVWTPEIRPIVDLHPKYLKDKFDLLTFKISRIWQRVYEDFGEPAAAKAFEDAAGTVAQLVPSRIRRVLAARGGARYDWYVRLWDDNYFYEENLQRALVHFDASEPVMTGKMGWRNMAKTAVYPFAGGGAGWYLSREGMRRLGTSIPEAEEWFVKFRARKDIFLPHGIHDEDVFLSAFLSILNVSFKNIPGVEHVSPGKFNKQRCMEDKTLYDLRWDPTVSIYFNYPGLEAVLRIEDATYAYFKPIIWHYMSPTRLVNLEKLVYPGRAVEFDGEKLPRTNSDAVKNRKCYPGVPQGGPPPRGNSLFERPVPDPKVIFK